MSARRWSGIIGGCLLMGAGLPACSKGAPAVSAIAIHPTNSQVVYAGTSGQLFKSRDGGESWSIAGEDMSSARVMSLAVDPSSPANLYAGTFGDAVWKSWDGGQHWTPDNRGLKEHLSIVTAIAFDLQMPSTMYLGSTVGAYKRTDPDGFWMERVHGMESVYVVALVVDPKRPETFYAGTSGGVYKSVNRIESWQAINRGLDIDDVGGALSHGVNSIALDPEKTTTLHIGTTRGLYSSTDGGESWTKNVSIPPGNIASIVIDPRDPSVLYAGGAGVFKSTDGGGAWSPVNAGLTSQTVRVLAIDPKNPETLYAGTNGGLFKTINGGQTWELKIFAAGSGVKPS